MADADQKLNRLGDVANLEKEVLGLRISEDGKVNSDYGVTLVRMHHRREPRPAFEKAWNWIYRAAITDNFLGTARLAMGHADEACADAYQEAIRLTPSMQLPTGT